MGKRAFILKLLQDVRASYWFLPSVLVVFGLLLATVLRWVDVNADLLPFSLADTFLDTQPDGARSTLSVIAQSIIGVAGVMFSMTLVAVSFASGNFGPRLIGNFMRDRGNQWSLGILISTFVYALVVLRTVQDGSEAGVEPFVPHYSLLMALVLTLACVFTLIYFVHHVPETINVSRISAGIGAKLDGQIRRLIDDAEEDEGHSGPPDRDPDHTLTAGRSGYVQTMNFQRLVALAKEHDWDIRLATSVGSFLTTQTPVFDVWSRDDLSEEQKDKLIDCYAIGDGRTENQNPTFLSEQLVEMIARALSPGVNDPYTAMDCLNRMAASLTVATTYKGGLQPRSLERVTFSPLTFEQLFRAGFPKCRQYIKPDDMTRAHARGLLEDLAEVARPQDRGLIAAEIEALAPET